MSKKQTEDLEKLDDETPTLSVWVAVSAWAATAAIALIMSLKHAGQKDWTVHHHPNSANKPEAIVNNEWNVGSTEEDDNDGE